MQFMLMQPKKYPDKLLTYLAKFFKGREKISKSFFSLIQFQEVNNGPDFLIAIEADDIENEIQLIINYLPQLNKFINDKRIFIVGVDQPPYQNYFSTIEPFYIKIKK